MLQEASVQNNIIALAKQFSFGLLEEKLQQRMLRFERDGQLIDVWYTKMSVGVINLGGTNFFAKNVCEEDLVEIFANPVHIKKLKTKQCSSFQGRRRSR